MDSQNNTEVSALLTETQPQYNGQPGETMATAPSGLPVVNLVMRVAINVIVNVILGVINTIQVVIASAKFVRRLFPLFCCCRCCCCCLFHHLHCLFISIMKLARDFSVFAIKWIRYSLVDIVTILTTTTTAGIVSPVAFIYPFSCFFFLTQP